VAAYTFGAPRVGDDAFWRTLRTPLHRVVNGRDIVPTVPPRRLGYAHGGAPHLLTAAGPSVRVNAGSLVVGAAAGFERTRRVVRRAPPLLLPLRRPTR